MERKKSHYQMLISITHTSDPQALIEGLDDAAEQATVSSGDSLDVGGLEALKQKMSANPRIKVQ